MTVPETPGPAAVFTPPSIVVGVDGSRAAERAALWAIDEAVGRELPLHLLAAAEGLGADRAEAALRAAAAVVAADGRSVVVTTEVVEEEPTGTLRAASGTAAMICLGAAGLSRGEGPAGSTVHALAASALCPLAVVRGDARRQGWVVTELDETADSAAVLQYAVEEARLRHAPLRVLGTWQPAGGAGTEDGDRLVRSGLDRRLETWRHRYPDLDVEPVATHGSGMKYLSAQAGNVQLIVIGARNVIAVNELLGPAGGAALPETSVIIVDRQRLL